MNKKTQNHSDIELDFTPEVALTLYIQEMCAQHVSVSPSISLSLSLSLSQYISCTMLYSNFLDLHIGSFMVPGAWCAPPRLVQVLTQLGTLERLECKGFGPYKVTPTISSKWRSNPAAKGRGFHKGTLQFRTLCMWEKCGSVRTGLNSPTIWSKIKQHLGNLQSKPPSKGLSLCWCKYDCKNNKTRMGCRKFL